MDPVLGDRGHLACFVAGRKEVSPTSPGVLIRPPLGYIRVEPDQDVQVVIQDREPRNGHGEDLSKFLKPMLDPAFTVEGPFPEQEGAATQRVTQ